MHSWPAAVLFDFDGVIVNSEPLHFHAFHEVLSAEKIELTETEYYTELIGFDDRGAFAHIFKKKNRDLDPRTFLRVMTNKSQAMMDLIHRRQYKALPGVEELVRALWRFAPLAICSAALKEEIEVMLEGIALRDCFSVIVSSEDVTLAKPDPQAYLTGLQQLGAKVGKTFKPKDALVIEDAPTVIRNVRAVGFPALGVATSYPIEKLGDADWAVKSLELKNVLKVIPTLKARV